MVQAAYETFAAEGFLGTTMAAVAKRAGVAAPTMYYTFGTKVALLGETLGAAIVGFDQWRAPPPEPFEIADLLPVHSWWADLLAAPTARDALGVFVAQGTDILKRVGPLVPALHGASGDPEGQEMARVSEERRVETYRAVVDVIATKPRGLRRGMTVETATDIMLVILSAEAYQGFAARGWTHERTKRYFTSLLTEQVLATAD
ncbi:putative TetR family transcriptional regulator [Gordonia rhizosphera NBRC 16068]|uniref:Putative TetR family transcriptional regulator n=2 Tax=Gordonia rhizosphera TaxID=83341 RepID=K6VQQ1_9ACTN|nr:putative TetR family transcriptional regulator [Gordonia rhizosphera NBRC 16068]